MTKRGSKVTNGKGHKATIGEIIKTARTNLRLKAEDVGGLCNVSRSRVYQWEAADYVFPKNLEPLSRALGIPRKKLEEANGSPHTSS